MPFPLIRTDQGQAMGEAIDIKFAFKNFPSTGATLGFFKGKRMVVDAKSYGFANACRPGFNFDFKCV
jgi:hypothetical protein